MIFIIIKKFSLCASRLTVSIVIPIIVNPSTTANKILTNCDSIIPTTITTAVTEVKIPNSTVPTPDMTAS